MAIADRDLPPRASGTLPFAELRRSGEGEASYWTARYEDRPTELHVHYLYRRRSPVFASDVLLADTQRLFPSDFPERVVHRNLGNAATMNLLSELGLMLRDRTFRAGHPVFEALTRTCRTNGSVMRRFVEDVGRLDPDHTYSISSITIRWSESGLQRWQPDMIFEIERSPSTHTCPATRPNSTAGGGDGCCLGPWLWWSPATSDL